MSRWMLIASEPRRPTERPQSWRICVRQTRAEGVAVSRSESAIRTLSRALGITAAAGVAGECAVRMRTRQGLWSNAGVFVRVWEYEVPGDRTGEFTAAYAADGAWGELFGRGGGVLGH